VRETLAAKQETFAEMDAMAAPDCILASSTSYIPASAFSTQLAGRARCLVAHPVNPPHIVPVVELCPAPWTAPEIVERARALHEAAKQVTTTSPRRAPSWALTSRSSRARERARTGIRRMRCASSWNRAARTRS
jgi:3-hydroxyacyl-CoA dehydrogenase